MWDIEVDVACVGAGVSILGTAMAGIDAGAEVLVASPAAEHEGAGTSVAVKQQVGGFLRSWSRVDLDVETEQYITAMSEELAPDSEMDDSGRVTVRTVKPVAADDDTVETFVGSRLSQWSTQCLISPYGMTYSTASGWWTVSQMRASDGQVLDVQRLGSINPVELADGNVINDWMLGQIRARDIDVRMSSPMERILFEDGRIIGVELSTPDGLLAVGVRHGLAVSSRDSFVGQADPVLAPSNSTELQVCLVGLPASRFLKIELLDTVADIPVRALCTATGRQLRDGMRESRSMTSVAGRCGKAR